MTVSEYIYKQLKDIAKTVPTVAPVETEVPYIVYNLDGQDSTKVMSGGGGVVENFVNITVYEDEYDKAAALAEQVKGKLLCVQPTKENIIGITFTSSSTGHDSEPVKRYFVTLEFSIYERG